MLQQLIIGAGCRFDASENLVVYDGDGRPIGSLRFCSADAVANMIGGLTGCEFVTRDAEVPSLDAELEALEPHEVQNARACALAAVVPAMRMDADDAAAWEHQRLLDETCRFDGGDER